MNTTKISAITLLLTLAILTGCSTVKTQTIGAIYPQTGPVAVAGEFVQEGIELAVEELEKEGKYITIITEDSKCSSKEGINAIQKLTTQVNAIIGPFCSSVAVPSGPIADTSKTIILSSGAASPLYTKAGDFAFRVSPSDVYQAKYMAEVLSKYENIGVLYALNQQASDMTDAFTKTYPNTATIESFEEDSRDVKTQLLKIKESNPEALFILAFPQHHQFISQQINELNINLPLYATHTFETPASLQLGKDAEKYIYSIQSYDRTTKQAIKFQSNYRNKYNKEPSVWTAYTYDAAMLLAKATEVCTTAECIKNYLHTTTYNGVTGLKHFDENGDISQTTYELKTVRDGTFTSLH